MRGGDRNTGALFSYVSCEARVAKSHPPRAIRQIVDAALLACRRISRRCTPGWAAINPAREAASSAVTAGVLFGGVGATADGAARLQSAVRWFVGLSLDTRVWDANVFTKNRDRLVDGEVAAKFMAAVLTQPRVRELLSAEHFSVDGTLIEAWASMKSFRSRD